MIEIQIVLLLIIIISVFFIYKKAKNPVCSFKYKHPSHAVGVGPVWTETQGPPIHYMYVWHDKDAKRLHMEFRNLPGIVISSDDIIIQELSEALKTI